MFEYMFKNPFSFKGRIRRLEYGLSIVIYYSYILIAAAIVSAADCGNLMIAAILFPAVWFVLAQSFKRCHDIGSSGWHQVFPHFSLLMLLVAGVNRPNKYGLNPKAIDTPTQFSLIDMLQ